MHARNHSLICLGSRCSKSGRQIFPDKRAGGGVEEGRGRVLWEGSEEILER